MFTELHDPLCEQGNLHLGGSGVTLMAAVLTPYDFLALAFEGHEVPPGRRSPRRTPTRRNDDARSREAVGGTVLPAGARLIVAQALSPATAGGRPPAPGHPGSAGRPLPWSGSVQGPYGRPFRPSVERQTSVRSSGRTGPG